MNLRLMVDGLSNEQSASLRQPCDLLIDHFNQMGGGHGEDCTGMTIKSLKESPLFLLLQPKEQEWVLAYIKSGDASTATKTIFSTATDNATKQMTMRLLAEPRIGNVIAAWNGELSEEPSIDEYRKELWRQAKNCKSDAARAALMRLYGETRGFIKRTAANQPAQIDPHLLEEIENT